MTQTRPFMLGDCLVEPGKNVLTGRCGPVSVQPRVMQLLVRLSRTPGEPVSRGELIDAAWQGAPYVSDESLTKAVSLLRTAIRTCSGQKGTIRTIPKVGYMLTIQLRTDDSSVGKTQPGDREPREPAQTYPLAGGRRRARAIRWGLVLAACLLAYWTGVHVPSSDAVGQHPLEYAFRTSIADSLDWADLLSEIPAGSEVVSDSTWIDDGDPKVIRRRIALASNQEVHGRALD